MGRCFGWVLTACAALGAAGCAGAGRIPQPPDLYVPGERVAQIPQDDGSFILELRGFEANKVQQERDVWCWAACASMVHGWNGRSMTQEQVADAIHRRAGSEDPEKVAAATNYEIMLALCDEEERVALEQNWEQWQDRLGQVLLPTVPDPKYAGMTPEQEEAARSEEAGYLIGKATGAFLQRFMEHMSLDDAMADLQAGQPVVVGLDKQVPGTDTFYGHAVVLYGLRVKHEPVEPSQFLRKSGYTYLTAIMLDPENGERWELDATLFADRQDFMMSQPQARQTLAKELGALQEPATTTP
jgi:hypothetical protein